MTTPITWAYVNNEWVGLTGQAYFDVKVELTEKHPSKPTGPSDMQPGQTLVVGTTFYIRLPDSGNPSGTVVRLPQGYGIHLYRAHDVVLDGINVAFATKGYQVEPDDVAGAAATN